MIHIDFETYSEADLSNGVHVYAEHPSTDVLCMVWDDELWVPGQPFPERLAGEQLAAWHAQFERVIWQRVMVEKYGWPEVPLEKWVCTQAAGLAIGLPARLDKAAEFLGLSERKDAGGHRLMLRISKPISRGKMKGCKPQFTDEDLAALHSYCRQDVVVERAIAERIPPLSEKERQVWLMDQRINDRGLPVDVRFAQQADMLWESYSERLNEEVASLTGGIRGTQVGALTRWVKDRYPACTTLGKPAVAEMLRDEALPDEVRTVLKLRLEIGSTAVRKYKKICACAGSDNRIRGTLRYHKASTGRWAGALIQPQNLPRGMLEEGEIPEARSLVEQGDSEELRRRWGDVGDVLGSLCRQSIRSQDGLVAVDFASIEARCVAWLAGEHNLLKAFRNDEDPYVAMAQRIFPTVGKTERTIGKALVLGCGYQMGGLRFKGTLQDVYGLDIPEEAANQYVKAYRQANPKIVSLWYALNDAIHTAVLNSNIEINLPPLSIKSTGEWLTISLPSGRQLYYYRPEMGRNVDFLGSDAGGNAYREKLYGGKILENCSQAICRDLLVDAMFRLEKYGSKIIATIHDEVLIEGGELDKILDLTTLVPHWAKGFPVDVSGWTGNFYKKD